MNPVNETVYSPESPLKNPFQLLKRIVKENWERRELVAQLFTRNIKAQYRQTLLGLLWIFLPAIISASVWIFLHSFQVVRFGGELTRSDYLVHIVVGMFLWQSFVEAFTSPINAFQQNRNMMAKINFPREIIILVSFLEVAFNAFVRSLILLPFLFFMGQFANLSLTILLFPIVYSGLILTGLTIGLLLVPLGALYLDIGKVLTMIAPVWMIITPIIYPTPTSYPANLVVFCNLASPSLITARSYLIGTEPQYQLFCWVLLAAIIPVFLLSVLVYRISIPIILERSGN